MVHLYSIVTCIQVHMFVHFFIQAKKWIADFIALSRFVDGYQQNNITPYMHLMAAHIPEMITLHGNMKQFSCQGECQ